jgi:hypothetical protein
MARNQVIGLSEWGLALAPERRGGAGSVFKNPGMTTPEGVPHKI